MTTKTIGAMLAAVACGATLAIAGCETRTTAPESGPAPNNGGPKSHNVLTDCVDIFTGVENCAIGSASIAGDAAARTVTVTGFDADGGDGVSSSFPSAVEWLQRSTRNFGGRAGASLHFAAISDGQAVSELQIAPVDRTISHYTPTFTAADGGNSRFHVHVYLNGVLQGGQVGVNPGTVVNIVSAPDQEDRDGGFKRRNNKRTDEVNNGGFNRRNALQQNADNDWQVEGACEWSEKTTQPDATFSVQLPNGTTLVGNEVLFTEEVAAGQAVYEDFQRIDVTGNLESYTITSESSVPAE